MQLVSAIIHKGSSGDYGYYVTMLKIGNKEWVYNDDQNDIMALLRIEIIIARFEIVCSNTML